MKRRIMFFLIVLVATATGATAAYLALSIPNDIRAEALLRQARDHMREDQAPKAREIFVQIVREYPRTDAAATASSALFRMDGEEKERLQAQILNLSLMREDDVRRIAELEKRLARMATAAAAPPAPATPPPSAAAAKKPPPKKPAPTRRR